MRYFAAVEIQQQARQGRDVLGLGAIETDGLDIVGDAFFAEGRHGAGRRMIAKQGARGSIDALVRGLG